MYVCVYVYIYYGPRRTYICVIKNCEKFKLLLPKRNRESFQAFHKYLTLVSVYPLGVPVVRRKNKHLKNNFHGTSNFLSKYIITFSSFRY